MESSCIIGIGSNIHPYENIYEAVKILEEEFEVIQCTSFAHTKPLGITDQPEFLNGAILLHTLLGINEMNIRLKSIEKFLGRDRNQPKDGPRTIDLDVVAWNGKIVDEDYYKRDFLKKAVDELFKAEKV
ncbi:MAG: 2-amino-4-hydroxy-6-hydroxymethyldihydropteridine diphosphokinase [Bacteroidota bacterium]|nr:2-amino-4-hydroxy-6-hydroxymethyldihydropteridine diphosphokinase [Bacteroidota bacterium]